MHFFLAREWRAVAHRLTQRQVKIACYFQVFGLVPIVPSMLPCDISLYCAPNRAERSPLATINPSQ